MNILRLTKTLLILIAPFTLCAQVGIGTSNPETSSVLELKSTSKGFLPPRMTRFEMLGIQNAVEGLLVYCTDCPSKGIQIYDGTVWRNIRTDASAAITTFVSSSGQIWMDRNLGASRVALSITDTFAYGDLYQWGRTTDGHQSRSSLPSAGPVASGTEGDAFITTSANPHDWLTTSDDTRWDGATKGAHDPCPPDFRVPSESEWNAEIQYFSPNENTVGAFNHMQIPSGGLRLNDGFMTNVNSSVHMWTRSVSGTNSRTLEIAASNGSAVFKSFVRSLGLSVRCIKE